MLISQKFAQKLVFKQYRGLTPCTDWVRSPEEQIQEKQKNKKNGYINNSNFEWAFSVILQRPPPKKKSTRYASGDKFETFLENYRDILKSVGKIVEKS